MASKTKCTAGCEGIKQTFNTLLTVVCTEEFKLVSLSLFG